MADVTGSGTAREERGQLVLLGSVVLGLLLVGLALVLNSAIFAENLATRQTSDASSDAQSFESGARAGVADAIGSANRDHAGSPFTDLRDAEYRPAVEALEERLSVSEALEGTDVDLTAVRSRNGIQLADDDATSALTPRGGSPVNWTVANESHIRAFELTAGPTTATATSDVTGQLTGGTGVGFVVTLAAASGTAHDIAVYEDSDDGTVRVLVSEVGESTHRECDATGDAATLSLTGRPTVDGEYCRALLPVAEATGTYDVRFVNGDLATGTYRLVVDRAKDPLDEQVDGANYGDACSGTTFADTTADSPHSVPAIYAGTVGLGYRNDRVSSETRLRVAPDQAGEALTTPLVTSLTVTDTSDQSGAGDAAFGIDWAVEDPDGNLSAVTVVARNLDDGTTRSDTTSVVGTDAASGTFSFSDGGDGDDRYDLTVTVTDGTHSRSRRVTRTADGDATGCPP